MLHQILIGAAVGIVAKFLLPGRDPGGFIVTPLIGIAGGWLGGQISQKLGWSQQGTARNFLTSVGGAMLLLVIYRML